MEVESVHTLISLANLQGSQVYLRPLSLQDVSDDYIAWMNDYEVVKYTESRFMQHTRQSIEDFVRGANNENTHTFAIIAKEGDTHIGNIKLGGINWHHRYADVGLIIGSKEHYGRGIATECIRLVTEYAFKHLVLHKVWCGIYEPNIGSLRAFQKAGWEIYGTEPQKCLFEGQYVDCHYLHKINCSGNYSEPL